MSIVAWHFASARLEALTQFEACLSAVKLFRRIYAKDPEFWQPVASPIEQL
jgi:hypothetical protein